MIILRQKEFVKSRRAIRKYPGGRINLNRTGELNRITKGEVEKAALECKRKYGVGTKEAENCVVDFVDNNKEIHDEIKDVAYAHGLELIRKL